MEAKLKDY